MHGRREQDGATCVQDRGPCALLWSAWAEGWVLMSAHHAWSSLVPLENQRRVYSLDGSVVSGKQESPRSAGG